MNDIIFSRIDRHLDFTEVESGVELQSIREWLGNEILKLLMVPSEYFDAKEQKSEQVLTSEVLQRVKKQFNEKA